MSSLLTLNIFDTFFQIFFADFEIPERILYHINLNLSVCFKVASRGPVTFKIKLSVTTVNNSLKVIT